MKYLNAFMEYMQCKLLLNIAQFTAMMNPLYSLGPNMLNYLIRLFNNNPNVYQNRITVIFFLFI